MKVSELAEEFQLINDSHEIAEIRDFLRFDLSDCDSLFVKCNKDGGDFEAVYGFEGIVPLLDKTLTLLFSR